MNNIDFLNVAKALIDQTVEVSHRIAAGRAYYFSFHQVKNHFNLESINKISHKSLILLLLRSKNNAERQAGMLMSECKRMRELADYRLDRLFTKQTARESINLAEKIKLLLFNEVKKPTKKNASALVEN